MGLYKMRPPLSGRMGILRTLATIQNAALIEYGCMGHMLYGRVFLDRAGVAGGCKLYSTHINEADISLGDTGRLSRTLDEIMEKDRPEAVFLLPSSVPSVIGTDLPALCRELQLLYPGVPLVPFGGGGFDVHGYKGVEEALLLLVQAFPQERERTPVPTFNIIGSCADLFRFQADGAELCRILKGAFGMDPVCVLASDASVQNIKEMGSAHLNVVIRREGKAAARHLQQRFGTPYLTGRPYGVEGTRAWLKEAEELLGQQADTAFIQREAQEARTRIFPAMPVFRHIIRSHPEEATLCLGGHADVVQGILRCAVEEFSFNQGACWCDCPDMASEAIPYQTEEEWQQAILTFPQGIIMASGEALKWAGRSDTLQIANPDMRWRLCPYEPPLVGFRGAVHLVNLWVNAAMENQDS